MLLSIPSFFNIDHRLSYFLFPMIAADLDEGVKQKKLGALRKALSIYSSRLGLEFKQGTGAKWGFIRCTSE